MTRYTGDDGGDAIADRLVAPVADGIYRDVSEVSYHGDKASLSSSGARKLVGTSPMEFRYELDNPPKPKRVFDLGSCVHRMILGAGAELVLIDAEDYKTKAAQKQRDEAWGAGKTPVLQRELDEAQRMAGQLFSDPLASALLTGGEPEISGWWTDPETGARLRFRPDYASLDVPGRRPLVVDYKTAANAHPLKFAKSAADFGYYCQGDWYLEGVAATTGITDAVFVLIAQSKTPPYPVSVHQFKQEDLYRGKFRNRKAIRLWAQCLATEQWPGYEGINVINLPAWERKSIDSEIEQDGDEL